jgi:hypothetical protein
MMDRAVITAILVDSHTPICISREPLHLSKQSLWPWLLKINGVSGCWNEFVTLGTIFSTLAVPSLPFLTENGSN